MKIKRLKLKNFIGIMHGLGTDEIELDFTKGSNRITMFRGGNGSGKSTILGSLTPFKQSTDNRENLILEGCDGVKEIDIEHDGHDYKIVHYYPNNGVAQSFIKKDNVELNENGGVKSCEDIISHEIGLTKDYFKIGKIGSNTRNFVDFQTAERKNYIGTFLDIDDYIKAYKVASEKLKVLKKDVISVANELKVYEDKSVIETKIKNLEKEIKELEASLTKDLPVQGSIEANLTTLNLNINASSPMDELLSRKLEKENDIEVNKNIKLTLETEIAGIKDNINEMKSKLLEEISSLQGDIRVNESNKTNMNSLIIDYQNKIDSLQLELSNLGNPEDIERLKTEISENSEELNEISKNLKDSPVNTLIGSMRKEQKDVSKYLGKFTTFIEFIIKYITNLKDFSHDKVHPNIEIFMENDCEESIARQIKQSRLLIDSKNMLLSEQEKSKSSNEAHACQAKTLDKRPAKCTIDDCPFICEALKYKNIAETLKLQEYEIAQLKEDLEVLGVKAENIQEILNLFKLFKENYAAVSPRENSILSEFLKEKSLVQWVVGPLSELQASKETLVSNIIDFQSNMEKYLELSQLIKVAESSKKIFEESGSTVRSKYEKDISEYEKNKETVKADYIKLDEHSVILNSQLAEKQKLLERYDLYLVAISKLASAMTMLSTTNSEITKLTEYLDEKKKLTLELSIVKTRILEETNLKSEKSTEYNNLITLLGQIKQLNGKLEKLKVQYTPTEIVCNSLSPTSGIPLVLIKMYLSETETITNELLDIAYNGDFRIKFDAGEKDFKIQVEAKGNVKDDIKLASQGEIALTTISISLALIEQSIGAYNILCLDEIDGALDKDNRENFINILNGQIDKLGIEQVFVISHNNAFDTCPMNLVLLKESDVDENNTSFMENKSIIFKV